MMMLAIHHLENQSPIFSYNDKLIIKELIN